MQTVTAAQGAPAAVDADSCIGIGISNGVAGRLAFETAARQCYEHAGVPWHGNLVWVSSPLVVVLAAPMAALLRAVGSPDRALALEPELDEVVRTLAQDTQEAELRQGLREAVAGGVREPPGRTLAAAVRHGLAGTLASELRCAAGLTSSVRVLRPLRLAVHASVQAALARTPRSGPPLTAALVEVIARGWYRYICGQHSHAFGLLLDDLYGPGDLRQRERVYQHAVAGACCWYPHMEFLLASEWPAEMPLEDGEPQLSGAAALSWPDGWGVPAMHSAPGAGPLSG